MSDVIMGTGREYDFTFKCDDSVKTTTSQYKVVSMIPGTTTSSDFTVCLVMSTTSADMTMAAMYPIGIVQSYQDSNSEVCTVRMFGVSRAECGASVGVGSFVMAYAGASTTARIGCISQVPLGATTPAATHSITSHRVILGRALESGSTGTVISIFVNPQLSDAAIIGTTTV